MVFLFAKLGFMMFFCAFAASFLRIDFSFIFAFVAVLSALFFAVIKRKFTAVSALLIAAALGFGVTAYDLSKEFYPAKALDGVSAEIEGVVTEVYSGGGNPVYVVKTDRIDAEGALQNVTVKLSGWEENFAEPYDKIRCTVNFYTFENGDINEFLTNRSGGVSVYAYTESTMEVLGTDRSFGYWVNLLREKISSVIYERFIDWHAPFADSLITGNRTGLESRITSAFRGSGLGHILAISGMHMVIVIGLLEKLLCYRRSSGSLRKAETFLLILAAAAYMLIGGLGMSVIRSGIMLIAHYSLRLLLNGSKALDNLGIAIIAVLLADPSAACDIGFIMSAASCCAILVLAGPFKKYLAEKLKIKRKFPLFAAETFAVSVVAFAATLPVSVLAFGEVSVVAPFSNLFAVIFAQGFLVFAMAAVVLGFVPLLGFLSSGAAFAAMLFSGALFKVADFFSSLPFATVSAESFWVLIFVIGAVLIFIVPALCSKSLRYVPISAAIAVFVFAAGLLAENIFYSGVSSVTVSALEHGTAVVCSKDGSSVLIARGLTYGDAKDLSSAGNYDYIISFDADSGSAELELSGASSPEYVLLSTDAAENSVSGLSFPAEIGLWADSYVRIFSEGVFAAELEDISLLYISEECDIMYIDPKFRRADVIILDGVSPEDYPALRCEYMILREFGGFYSGTTELITLKEGDVSFFAFEKNIRKGWQNQ